MKKPTLLILAAGMGSRYGGDKQIDGFGPNQETILEYSVYDAIRFGFEKVVFIVRKEILEIARSIFIEKFGDKVKLEFVVQGIDSKVPPEFQNPDRKKPYGTAHALLCAQEVIDEPFAVINADDFYGAEAFKNLGAFLSTSVQPDLHCMVGYAIKDVLSKFGSVSRGVCTSTEEGYLSSMVERTSISYKNGRILHEQGDEQLEIQPDNPVSMNCWGFHPSVFQHTERLWREFLAVNKENTQSEFYIPKVANALIQENLGNIKILKGGDVWFGVTYAEDRPHVMEALKKLHAQGVYPSKLW